MSVSNSPLRAAVFPGYDEQLGALGFETLVVRSSAEQRELAESVDVLLTAPDNLYAWGTQASGWALVAGGEVAGLGLFRGPTDDGPLLVDAPDSGFAFLARTLDEADRPVLAVGATPMRHQALREGRGATALLHPPFTEGVEQVNTVEDAFGPYQSMIIAARSLPESVIERLLSTFGSVSSMGLRRVWELRRTYAPAACPPDWRLPTLGAPFGSDGN